MWWRRVRGQQTKNCVGGKFLLYKGQMNVKVNTLLWLQKLPYYASCMQLLFQAPNTEKHTVSN